MALIGHQQGLRLAVIGCTHGALDVIYQRVAELEQENDYTIDAVLCCGDFQAIRNSYDLETMVTPNKYRKMEDFWAYYSGVKVAPKLTIFIGGNHEAVAHNRELYYGGWAAPNIYFMGYSGIINLGGLRIGGFSGIYDHKFFKMGHHELTPYSKNDLHSAMYVRLWELWKLSHLTGNIDALMSHDWPEYIAFFGNTDDLLRNNPFFKKSLDENDLGCEAYLALMKHLKPANWFAGHMHTRFVARVGHEVSSASTKAHKDYVKMLSDPANFKKPAAVVPGSTSKSAATNSAQTGAATQFLALDKPLPGRKFLEVVHFPFASAEREETPLLDVNGEPLPLAPRLAFDLEWLSIIRATHDLFPNHKGGARIPPSIHVNALAKHRDWIVKELLHGDENNWAALTIPRANFVRSAAIHVEGVTADPVRVAPGVGPQAALFLDWLQLDHAKLAGAGAPPSKPAQTPKAKPASEAASSSGTTHASSSASTDAPSSN